jgi:hypothetical protein
MAGAGYKSFAVGEILTAANVNTYLMDQAVTVFASTTARDAAITSPSEGMISYSTADDSYYHYSGSAWIPFVFTWKSWTPTINNVTLGTGYTLSATYAQIGKTVIANFYFALGSTSAITGDVNFSLPVNHSSTNRSMASGNSTLVDASPSARYSGMCYPVGTPSYCYVRVYNASATYTTQTALTSLIPITWTTSDSIACTIVYEAA